MSIIQEFIDSRKKKSHKASIFYDKIYLND